MRIGIDAHTVGTRRTGNETYVRNLIAALSDLSPPDVEFVFYHTMAVDTTGWRGVIKQIRPQNPLIRIPISFPHAMKRDRLDAAHFQYITPPYSPCPVINIVHDISFEFVPQFFNPIERWRMKLMIPRAVRAADRLMTLSEYSKRSIAERYGVQPDRITVTPLAPAEVFRPLNDETVLNRVREKYALPRRFILAVGNLQPRKNLGRLISAFAHLRKTETIPHELVLVGQPWYKGSKVADRTKQLGIDHLVKMTGYVSEDELVALYNLAEVFVYPSLHEGFGLPVLEAMACGTAVVTSNVTSLPEVAGDAALLVDPYSEEQIADAVGRLVSDAHLRERLSHSGLKQAAKFSWRRVAEQTLEVYRSVV